jgi:hypothetical protein
MSLAQRRKFTSSNKETTRAGGVAQVVEPPWVQSPGPQNENDNNGGRGALGRLTCCLCFGFLGGKGESSNFHLDEDKDLPKALSL